VAAVLVDAGSTVTADDLATVGSLLNAGIRTSVLVSKADLLAPADLDRAMAYVRDVLTREFRSTIPVAAVSVKPELDRLFDHWRRSELEPLVANQERERQTAAARKTEILRSQVEVALRQLFKTPSAPASPDGSAGSSRHADAILQSAGGEITELERRLSNVDLHLPRRREEILTRTAALIDQQRDPLAALQQAFHVVAGEAAAGIRHDLEELVNSLNAAVHKVSSSVQWAGDVLNGPDADGRFREVPVPALPPDLTVPREGAERMLGHGLARLIVARRLERTVGDAVEKTLESYASVLRRWALENLNDIRGEWSATTDALRARLDRELGHSQEDVASADEIAGDLRRLGPAHDRESPAGAHTRSVHA
jgi:hypothetical protein